MTRTIFFIFATVFILAVCVAAWGAERCDDPAERLAGVKKCEYIPQRPVQAGTGGIMFDRTPLKNWRLP
jgi:hypothetical protein